MAGSAQTIIEPHALIGETITSATVQDFLKKQNLALTVGGRYSSTTSGIELRTQRDTVISIDFYRSNAAFGKYTGVLYKNMVFGMSSNEVIGVLGKPAMSYTNSGYSEYNLNGVILTVWFENKQLSQVSFSK